MHRIRLLIAALLLTVAAPEPAIAALADDYLAFSPMSIGTEWRLKSPFTETPIIWRSAQANIWYDPPRIEYYAEYRDPWGAFHTLALEPEGSRVYLNGVIYRPETVIWRQFPSRTVLFDFDAPEGTVWTNALGIVVVTDRRKTVVTGRGILTECIQFWVISWEGSETVWTFAPHVGLVQFGESDWAFLLQ